jgi:hypothetical protein
MMKPDALVKVKNELRADYLGSSSIREKMVSL